MDRNVKIALVILGVSISINLATYFQLRSYFEQIEKVTEVMRETITTNDKIVTDLAFAGIIDIQKPDDSSGESSDSQE